MNPNPTATEVGKALSEFGNYRVLRSQELAHGKVIPASVLMALGLRESGLKNICGGAILEDGKWVQSYSDRGCFQISDKIEPDWLKSVPGCLNGHWSPVGEVSAFQPMHVPRFTDAAIETLRVAKLNYAQAKAAGVKAEDLVRFCVAAHNAGFQGALKGYREGDVDLHTTHNDYSAWVMRESGVIHAWVLAHPNWRWDGKPLNLKEE